MTRSRIFASFALASILVSASFKLFANDSCADILREGVRDELASSHSLKHRFVKHHQFCTLAKKHSLNSDTFNHFAKDYAKYVDSNSSSHAGGAGVNYGIFSFDGDYDGLTQSSYVSDKEKQDYLFKHKVSVLQYYEQNCGNFSYEDMLQQEAFAMSKIANPAVVHAWKECVLNRQGLFVQETRDEDLIHLSIHLHWRSDENTAIEELSVKWAGDNIEVPYETKSTHNFHEIVNLCKTEDLLIHNHGEIQIPVHRKSNHQSDRVYILIKTNTGLSKATSVLIPASSNNAKSSFTISYRCPGEHCLHSHTPKNHTLDLQEEYSFSSAHLHTHFCSECGARLLPQLEFRNLYYKVLGKLMDLSIVEYPWKLADEISRSFPAHNPRNDWKQLKVKIRSPKGFSIVDSDDGF